MRDTILPKAIILTKGHGQYNGPGVYCGLSTASELFLLPNYSNILVFFFFYLFALVSDEPEIFIPEYSQTVILNAAHYQGVVNFC